ncbi:hypothetical protein GCM10010187_47500 [Actinomadura coerulea]|nr:hypothetical protein GCM10010187_47500 [Actinomadura coerulea]
MELVVFFLPVREFGSAALAAALEDQSGAWASAVGLVVLPTAAMASDSSHALQWLRFLASGVSTTTTRRVPASMTTWWSVECR